MKKVFAGAMMILALGACQTNRGGATAGDANPGDTRRVETVYDIAYISMDSLVSGYNRYKDLSAEFETKATRIQTDLEARARRLQNEMVDFEEKATKGLETRARLAELQTQIQTRGEQFDNDRQNRLNELAEEEQVMTNQVYHAITQYIAKFNADYRYKMILASSGGSPVLHAEPALNITAEVLKGLNEEYAVEKAGK